MAQEQSSNTTYIVSFEAQNINAMNTNFNLIHHTITLLYVTHTYTSKNCVLISWDKIRLFIVHVKIIHRNMSLACMGSEDSSMVRAPDS